MPNCKPTKLEEKFREGMQVLKQRLKQIARLKTYFSLNQKQVEAIQKERTWVNELRTIQVYFYNKGIYDQYLYIWRFSTQGGWRSMEVLYILSQDPLTSLLINILVMGNSTIHTSTAFE